MNYALIVARNNRNVIGKDGSIPWDIPEDLQWFQKSTNRKPIIMGRATWESLPKKPLPNRLNIIISSTMPLPKAKDHFVFKTLNEGVSFAERIIRKKLYASEIMFIGGQRIYAEAARFANKLYITDVDNDLDGDTLFPAIDMSSFSRTFEERHDGFTFNIYRKLNPNR